MRVLTEDLERLAPERWCVADHGALKRDPKAETARLSRFLGLGRVALEARCPVAEVPTSLRAELGPYLKRTRPLAERAADWLAAARV
jgi:hypothetical protein